jgi:hypothetical protein
MGNEPANEKPGPAWGSGVRAQLNVISGRIDDRHTIPPGHPGQAEIEAYEEPLEVKRGSIFRIGWRAYAHLEDMLGALEIADDESVWHHCKSVVADLTNRPTL